MNIQNTCHKFRQTVSKRSQRLVISFSVLLIVIISGVTTSCAIAQNLGAGEEYLLPPEVVPVDPSVFAKSAQSRASEIRTSEPGGVPGLAGNGNTSNVSAQEYRKAAFDSLMNQEKAMPINLPQYSGQNLEMIQTQMENQNKNNFGLSPLMTPPLDGRTSQSDSIRIGQVENFYPPYSQTLTGSVRNPVAYRPSRLAGFSHAVSLASLFGLSAFTGIYAGRRSPYGYYGLGLMGLGLANYGFRNGFRF